VAQKPAPAAATEAASKPETKLAAPKAVEKPVSQPAAAGPSAEALEALELVKQLKEQVERLQKKVSILTSDVDEEVRCSRVGEGRMFLFVGVSVNFCM
jgi:phage shock protein A